LEVFDCIRLRNWSVQAAIGAYDEEKAGTQELVLDVKVWGDFRRAAATDELAEAVDYAALRADLEAWIQGKRWNLLEAFGEQFCSRILRTSLVRRVELTVEKPRAQAPLLVSYTLIREN